MTNTQRNHKFNFINKIFMLMVILVSFVIGSLSSSQAFAYDASSKGMCYLRVQLDTGNNGISSSVDEGAVGNALARQNTTHAPEYEAEGVFFGKLSWDNTNDILKGKFPKEVSSPWNYFTNDDGYNTFNDKLSKDWTQKKQSSNLALSFPGWGAGNSIQNLNKGGDACTGGVAPDFNTSWNGDRNTTTGKESDGEPSVFFTINANTESAAANAVNQGLAADFQTALSDFYSHIKGSPTLSTAGLANMVMCVAEGYMPAKADTQIEYDSTTGTFSGSGLDRGSLVISKSFDSKNINKQSKAGKALVYFKTPNGSAGLDKEYTYCAVKGATTQCGDGAKYSASDEYALSWLDLANGAISNSYNPDGTSESSSGNNKVTVVQDQVNNWLYSLITGFLSMLGIQTVDQLVFGDSGNLLRNNVYSVYMALWIPFMLLAAAILIITIIDAYRKANMKYLSTNEVGDVQKSVGRVMNAALMICVTPLIVTFAIGLDQGLVHMVSAMDETLLNVVGGMDTQTNAVVRYAGAGIADIIGAIGFAFINIKFTFRYIARALSFGIYFVTSPVVFALDSLQGDGGLFQWGPRTGEAWKNMLGLIFQRAVDALGIVFALSLIKLIFGNHIFITIMGLMCVEALTNALMDVFGIKKSTFSGVAEAGREAWKKTGKPLMDGLAAGTAIGAGVLGAGVAQAKASRRNYNMERYLAAKKAQEMNRKNGIKKGDPNAFSSSDFMADGSFDSEAPVGTSQEVMAGAAVGNIKSGDSAVRGSSKFDASAPVSKDHGIFTKKGTKIVNERGLRNRDGNAFMQGLTNHGVYGDKNTNPLNGNGVMTQNGMSDEAFLSRYELGSDGKLHTKMWNTYTDKNGKEHRQFVGLKNGILNGGAAFANAAGATAGSGLKAMGYGALMGAATAIPGKLDDVVGGVITANGISNMATNGTGGIGGALGRSFAARMMGLKPGTLDYDRRDASMFNANGNDGGSPHKVMKKSDNGFGGQVVKQGISRRAVSTGDGMIMNTHYSSDIQTSTGKNNRPTTQAQAMSNAQNIIHHNQDMSGQQYSFEDLRDNHLFNADGSYNAAVGGLMDHMMANGYNTVTMPTLGGENELTFGTKMQRADEKDPDSTFDFYKAENGDSSYQQAIANGLKSNSQGITTDAANNTAFKRNGGTVEKWVTPPADDSLMPDIKGYWESPNEPSGGYQDDAPVATSTAPSDPQFFPRKQQEAINGILNGHPDDFLDEHYNEMDGDEIRQKAVKSLYGADLDVEGSSVDHAANELARTANENAAAHIDYKNGVAKAQREYDEEQAAKRAAENMTPEEKEAEANFTRTHPTLSTDETPRERQWKKDNLANMNRIMDTDEGNSPNGYLSKSYENKSFGDIKDSIMNYANVLDREHVARTLDEQLKLQDRNIDHANMEQYLRAYQKKVNEQEYNGKLPKELQNQFEYPQDFKDPLKAGYRFHKVHPWKDPENAQMYAQVGIPAQISEKMDHMWTMSADKNYTIPESTVVRQEGWKSYDEYSHHIFKKYHLE